MKVIAGSDREVSSPCYTCGGTSRAFIYVSLGQTSIILFTRYSFIALCPTHWAQLRPTLMRALLESEI